MADKESKFASSPIMEKGHPQERERIISRKRKRKGIPTRFVPSDENFLPSEELYEVPVVYLPLQAFYDFIANGQNFVSHLLIVNEGEDIIAKIISFGQSHACNVYIVSAIGFIAQASICQSANVSNYEGYYSISSLQGHLSSTVQHNATSDATDITVTLMNKDGSSVRGIVSGPLVAAGEVHIVLWTCRNSSLKMTSAPGSSSAENSKGKEVIPP